MLPSKEDTIQKLSNLTWQRKLHSRNKLTRSDEPNVQNDNQSGETQVFRSRNNSKKIESTKNETVNRGVSEQKCDNKHRYEEKENFNDIENQRPACSHSKTNSKIDKNSNGRVSSKNSKVQPKSDQNIQCTYDDTRNIGKQENNHSGTNHTLREKQIRAFRNYQLNRKLSENMNDDEFNSIGNHAALYQNSAIPENHSSISFVSSENNRNRAYEIPPSSFSNNLHPNENLARFPVYSFPSNKTTVNRDLFNSATLSLNGFSVNPISIKESKMSKNFDSVSQSDLTFNHSSFKSQNSFDPTHQSFARSQSITTTPSFSNLYSCGGNPSRNQASSSIENSRNNLIKHQDNYSELFPTVVNFNYEKPMNDQIYYQKTFSKNRSMEEYHFQKKQSQIRESNIYESSPEKLSCDQIFDNFIRKKVDSDVSGNTQFRNYFNSANCTDEKKLLIETNSSVEPSTIAKMNANGAYSEFFKASPTNQEISNILQIADMNFNHNTVSDQPMISHSTGYNGLNKSEVMDIRNHIMDKKIENIAQQLIHMTSSGDKTSNGFKDSRKNETAENVGQFNTALYKRLKNQMQMFRTSNYQWNGSCTDLNLVSVKQIDENLNSFYEHGNYDDKKQNSEENTNKFLYRDKTNENVAKKSVNITQPFSKNNFPNSSQNMFKNERINGKLFDNHIHYSSRKNNSMTINVEDDCLLNFDKETVESHRRPKIAPMFFKTPSAGILKKSAKCSNQPLPEYCIQFSKTCKESFDEVDILPKEIKKVSFSQDIQVQH